MREVIAVVAMGAAAAAFGFGLAQFPVAPAAIGDRSAVWAGSAPGDGIVEVRHTPGEHKGRSDEAGRRPCAGRGAAYMTEPGRV